MPVAAIMPVLLAGAYTSTMDIEEPLLLYEGSGYFFVPCWLW